MNFFRRSAITDPKSPEEMAMMIEDLKAERDSLREQVKKQHEELVQTRKERDDALEFNQENLNKLLNALNGKRVQVPKNHSISPEEAAEMTIQSLTETIEDLNIQNTEVSDRNSHLEKRIMELEHENDARKHKIDALEVQFKSINKTRQKMVQKLVDGTVATPKRLPFTSVN